MHFLPCLTRLTALGALALATSLVHADSSGPYVIPIYHDTTSGGTGHLIIYVGLNGGHINPYLLDTGSPNVFSTYNPAWWPGTTAATNSTAYGDGNFSFASGTGYNYNVVSANVTIGDQDGNAIVTATNVNVGQIIAIGSNTPLQAYTNWQNSVDGGNTALSDDTYGNFGGALYGNSTLATVLSQLVLGPGLKNGFIVQSGGAGASAGNLIVGLSNETIAQFPIQLAMNATGEMLPSGDNAYQKAQVGNTTVVLSGNGNFSAVIPTVFDTGGGDNNVFYNNQAAGGSVPSTLINGGGNTGTILPGTSFKLQNADLQTFFSYLTGNIGAQNLIVVDGNLSGGIRMNPGIAMFYKFNVMFDIEDGIIGLQPIPQPEVPNIYTQPQPQTVRKGRTATFTVVVTGSSGPLTYQWFTGFLPLPGANSATLTLTKVAASQAGFYRVIVTNPGGSTISAVVKLTVVNKLTPLHILVPPQPFAAPAGTKGTLSIVVNVQATKPVSYQWFKGATVVRNSAGQINGAKTDTLIFKNLSRAETGVYHVVATNPAGSIKSPTARVTVR